MKKQTKCTLDIGSRYVTRCSKCGDSMVRVDYTPLCLTCEVSLYEVNSTLGNFQSLAN